jgi:DNA topoisomerase-2
MIVDGEIDIRGKSKVGVEQMLEENSFLKLANTQGKETSYDYLVQMPIYSLTNEKLQELKDRMEKKQVEYDTLYVRDIKDIWREELNELSIQVDKYYQEYDLMLSGEDSKPKQGGGKAKKK